MLSRFVLLHFQRHTLIKSKINPGNFDFYHNVVYHGIQLEQWFLTLQRAPIRTRPLHADRQTSKYSQSDWFSPTLVHAQCKHITSVIHA